MGSVLITGTSSGIGLATALALGRVGHQVFATMRDPRRAGRLAEDAARERLPVSILPMDVDPDASVKAVIDQIYAEGQTVAGIERLGSIEE